MKWFKHDTTARNDIKIKLLRGQFGNDGYAAFFILLEIIGENVKTNLNDWGFVDAVYTIEILAAECGVSAEKLRDILTFCNTIGLFEKKNERLFCKNIKGRLDEYAEKLRKQHNRKRSTSQSNSDDKNVGTLSGQHPDIVGTQSGQGPDSVGHKNKNKKENKKQNTESSNDTDQIDDKFQSNLSVEAPNADGVVATPKKLDIEKVAADLGVSLKSAQWSAAQLKDWCKAKGKRYKDWNAALRNWIRKDIDAGKIKKQVVMPPPPSVPELSPEERLAARKQIAAIRAQMPNLGLHNRKVSNEPSTTQTTEKTTAEL